jgi:hypothetical protein
MSFWQLSLPLRSYLIRIVSLAIKENGAGGRFRSIG